MIRLACLMCSILVAGGCATPKRTGTGAGAAATASESPPKAASDSEGDRRRQLLAALEREVEPLTARDVKGPQGRFTSSVEAAADPSVTDEPRFSTVNIPIGTRADISCFIYKESIDSGVSLQRIVQALAGNVTIEALRPVEIGAAGGRPVVFLELDYSADEEGGLKSAGQLKLMASPDDDLPLVCFHDELGYRRTFRRITRALAQNLGPRGTEPRFAEIQVFEVNGRPVGFEQRRIWSAEKQQTVIETVALLLLPKSASQLEFQDTVSTSVADAQDRVASHAYAKAVDGELVLQATLERGAGNRYTARGTRRGKEFDSAFTSADDAGLLSDVAIHRALKAQLLSGQQQELTFETYAPAQSVSSPVKVTYVERDGPPGAVAVRQGNTTITGELDAHGTMARIDMPLGPDARMTMERALVEGAP